MYSSWVLFSPIKPLTYTIMSGFTLYTFAMIKGVLGNKVTSNIRSNYFCTFSELVEFCTIVDYKKRSNAGFIRL